MIYCTLFDSNYLDKGIAMIRSLLRVDSTAKVYILCMDKKSEEVLIGFFKKAVFLISLSVFMDTKLLELIGRRSKAEFCWTCTARLIKYVLINKNEDVCTYIDSDLYFYSNPQILLHEMISAGCSVQAIAHNFPHDKRFDNRIKTIGNLCVEFNTFTKSPESLSLLDVWIKQCEENCSIENGGDQKYTDAWVQYDFVNVSKNLGAGVAPWNVERFKKMDSTLLFDKESKSEFSIVFYHFQNVINKKRYSVSIEPFYHCIKIDKRLVLELYLPYIKELELIKRELEEKYGITPLVDKYTSSTNVKKNIWQKLKYFFSMSFTDKKSLIKHNYLKIVRRAIAEVDTSKF